MGMEALCQTVTSLLQRFRLIWKIRCCGRFLRF
ncbi:Uncharacterised protein [Vibrio cholerae]|nr:Uncharacterised protein [Vibrio cholerae]